MLDLPGLLHLMQPKCVRAALDVSSMLSFQTPSVWSVLLSIPINTWEPALMLLHLLRSPLNDNCQKKASVKLCQHNSLTSMVKMLLFWRRCVVFFSHTALQILAGQGTRQHVANKRVGAPEPKWC